MKSVELSMPLVKNKERIVTAGDFFDALRSVGIVSGDIVCVHSSLLPLGTPLLPKEEYLNALAYILMNAVGQSGTLLMPAFSYSFCDGKDYDRDRTPSTVGLLTEYFRKCPGVQRTMHPIFSFSIMGAAAEDFLSAGYDAFSLEDSVYAKMMQRNGKIVLLGAPLGYTFYYVAEQAAKVPHRYIKQFSGHLINKESKIFATVPYYVRKLDVRSREDEGKVSEYLREQGVQKECALGGGSIYSFECNPVMEALCCQLRKDPKAFLQE